MNLSKEERETIVMVDVGEGKGDTSTHCPPHLVWGAPEDAYWLVPGLRRKHLRLRPFLKPHLH